MPLFFLPQRPYIQYIKEKYKLNYGYIFHFVIK